MRIESERWVRVYFYTRTLAHFMNSTYALLNVFIFEVSNKIQSKFLNIISSQLKKFFAQIKLREIYKLTHLDINIWVPLNIY